jgi:hypothetical protein
MQYPTLSVLRGARALTSREVALPLGPWTTLAVCRVGERRSAAPEAAPERANEQTWDDTVVSWVVVRCERSARSKAHMRVRLCIRL